MKEKLTMLLVTVTAAIACNALPTQIIPSEAMTEKRIAREAVECTMEKDPEEAVGILLNQS